MQFPVTWFWSSDESVVLDECSVHIRQDRINSNASNRKVCRNGLTLDDLDMSRVWKKL